MSKDNKGPEDTPEGPEVTPESRLPKTPEESPLEEAESDTLTIDDKVLNLLSDHLPDGIPTSFFFVFEFINDEGSKSWGYANMPDQTIPTSMGLIEWAKGLIKYAQAEELDSFSYQYVVDDDDEDPDF